MSEGLREELEQVRVDNAYSGMSSGERTKMLKKLLGPLLHSDVLTLKESAFFFLSAVHDKPIRTIAAAMGVKYNAAQKVMTSATGKIKKYRKGRFWE